MKTFKEYLSESNKSYTFKVKVAGDMTNEQETTLKTLLDRYELSGFKKKGKTPIQELPLDFPQLKNMEVNIYEVTLAYPTTQYELIEYLTHNLAIGKDKLVVRSPNEPYEEYQQPKDVRTDALLKDSEYKESENAKFEDFYGDQYNSNFVKELNAVLKLQRKERGEVIPEASNADQGTKAKAAFNTDAPQNNHSPIVQAQDPRK